MKRRFKEALAVILALSMVLSAPRMTVLGAEDSYSDQEVILLEQEDAVQEELTEEVLVPDEEEELLEEITLSEEGDDGYDDDDKKDDDDDWIDEPTTPAKVTLMLYGVGSDLERNSFGLSYDMTEIISGLTAAKNTLGVEKLPINVIADLGGVSYEPTEADPEGTTKEDKIKNRNNARLDVKHEDSEFADYDKAMAALGDSKTSSYDIFSCLTPAVDFEEIVSGDVFNWELNQRYELLPLSTGEGGSIYCFTSAKNAYADGNNNQKIPMTQSDSGGVTTELYDFVKTTMEQYPSEQYVLVLWDHGAGEVAGFAVDERGGTSITSYNVKKTFEALKNNVSNWKNLSLVGYDACLMGTMQTMMAWEGTADYLVASEALEPGQGWDYIRWINRLCKLAVEDKDDAFANSSTMAAITEDCGKILVDDYVASYSKNGNVNQGTLALMRLNKDELAGLNNATDSFADALNAYLKAKPHEAYADIYEFRKDSAEFGASVDLRHLAFNAERNLYGKGSADETTDPLVTAVVEASQNIMKVFDSGKPVVYAKNTGYFEDWTAQGETQLGGVALTFPYNTSPSYAWGSYLDLYKKIDPGTSSWRDFMGSYVAACTAGEMLRDVYNGKYRTKEAALTALSDTLNKSLNDYNVSSGLASDLKSKIPALWYDNRITPDYLNVAAINEDYYFMPMTEKNYLLDDLVQHGWLYAGNKTYGLGTLPGGGIVASGDQNGVKLQNYNTNKWLWMKDNEGNFIYPASVFNTSLSDPSGDTMRETLSVILPATLYSQAKDAEGVPYFYQTGIIYLNVLFKDADKTAEIQNYQYINPNVPYANARVYEAEELKGQYLMPLYNVYESLVQNEDYTMGSPEGEAFKPISYDSLVISRGNEESGLKVFQEADSTLTDDNLFYTTGYYLTDKFESAYELHIKQYRSFGLRWSNSTSGNILRLPEGTLITKDDLVATVSVNGDYNDDETQNYAQNMIANAKIQVGDKVITLPEAGYVLTSASPVVIFLDEADLTAEKLISGFDALSEEDKAAATAQWNNENINMWDRVTLRINVVKNEVSEDDEYSGMDPKIPVTPTGDNTYRITLVTGQTYSLGKGQWKSDKPDYVTVGTKDGKLKAKKATAVAKTEEEQDEIVTVTNEAVTPNVKYEITVVTPAIYRLTDIEGKTNFEPAKKITLTTVNGDGEIYKARLSIMSAEVNNEVPANIAFKTAWTSSNPKVCEVIPDEEDGSTACSIAAVSKGSAKITAWVNGKPYTCEVKVTDVFGKDTEYGYPSSFGTQADDRGCFTEAASICINPGTALKLNYAKKSGFVPAKATWEYTDADGKVLKPEDSPAYVDKKGKLMGVRQGMVYVKGTYTLGDKAVSAAFDVYVVPVPVKRVTYITRKKTETLKFYKVNNKQAEWKTSNAAVATVDGSGKVTAVAMGEAEITCTYKGSVYTTTVYVEVPELDTSDSRITAGKKANSYTLTLKKGTRYIVSAPSVYQKLYWKSSKAACAFVDENGVIEARTAGKSTVSTKINGVTVKIDVIVEN